ncbi:MAG: hypothetical protein RLY31_3080 [Bacteroidota bacterium]|jgi:threonine dehydratase
MMTPSHPDAAYTAQALLDVQARITSYIHRTPVLTSRFLNQLTGAELFFKCENFQRMGAFKMRGAANAILCLSAEQRDKGVATHSSGNFAQALALAAKLLGVRAHIVMPSNAPAVKRAAVTDYGGRIITCPPTQQDRENTLAEVVADTGATFLHPYDQDPVILGQGTAALELIQDQPGLDLLLAPVGGGGLLAGSALAAEFFSPGLTVLGAEPLGADDAWQSLRQGRIVPSLRPDTIADGLRTSLGERTFPILRSLVGDIVRVSEAYIATATYLLFERMKLVAEPSGAVPLAAVLSDKERFAGKKVGIILSGGNVDLRSLGEIFRLATHLPS